MLIFHLHDKVQSGMAGLIIIDDDPWKLPKELEAASCPNHCDEDIQMVFQPLLQLKDNPGPRPNRGFIELQRQINDSYRFR